MKSGTSNQLVVLDSDQAGPLASNTTELTLGVNLGVFNANLKVANPDLRPPAQEAKKRIVRFKSMLAESSNKRAVAHVVSDVCASLEKTQFVEVLDNAPDTLNFYYDLVAHEFETDRKDEVMRLVWDFFLGHPAQEKHWIQQGVTFGEIIVACALIEVNDNAVPSSTKEVVLRNLLDLTTWKGEYRGFTDQSYKISESFFEEAWKQGLGSELELVIRQVLGLDGVVHVYDDRATQYVQSSKATDLLITYKLLCVLKDYATKISSHGLSTPDTPMLKIPSTIIVIEEGVINYESIQQDIKNRSRFQSAVACLLFSATMDILPHPGRKVMFEDEDSKSVSGASMAIFTLITKAFQPELEREWSTRWAQAIAELRRLRLCEWPYEQKAVVRNEWMIDASTSFDRSTPFEDIRIIKWGLTCFMVPKTLRDISTTELFLGGVAAMAGSVNQVVEKALELSLVTTHIVKPVSQVSEEDSAEARAREYINHLNTDDFVDVKRTICSLRETLTYDLSRKRKLGTISTSDSTNFYVVQYVGTKRTVHTNLTSGKPWLVSYGPERLNVLDERLGKLLFWRDILIDRLDGVQTINLSKLRKSIEQFAAENAWKLIMDVVLVMCENGRKIICKSGFKGCAIRAWRPSDNFAEEGWKKYIAKRTIRRPKVQEKCLIVDTTLHIEGAVICHDDCKYIERSTNKRKLIKVTPSARFLRGVGNISHLSEVEVTDDEYVQIVATSKGKVKMEIEADG